jgi:fumarylacetoacetase
VTTPGAIDHTNDPQTRSWLASAHEPECEFPLQNLPFAVFKRASRAGADEAFRGGVAIGDQIVDLERFARLPHLDIAAKQAAHAASASTLNSLMHLGPPAWQALRRALFADLSSDSPHEARVRACLVPQRDAVHALPAHIGDYTDFYSSLHHATAVGRLFRPDNPLLPNYKWLPIAYHGRSSSIAVSGQSFSRPRGQRLAPGASAPCLGPSQRLDYEFELGVFIGPGNARGAPIRLARAEEHIFGLCMLNDWSARDLQAWEYQPLGPFLAKNFATTISPWVVTLQALAPFRSAFSRPAGDPPTLPYLDGAPNREAGAIDIRLEAFLHSARMRAAGQAPQRLSSTTFRHAYWTVAQLVAHHTVNGCDLRPGDLLGTGTQSGPTPPEAGSLLELSVGGTQPIALGDERRTFLEDGDTVIFRAWCEAPGAVRIGFGELQGQVLPASDLDLPGDLEDVVGV